MTTRSVPAAIGTAASPRREWGRTLVYAALLCGVALAYTLAFAPGAHAAGDLPDPTAWATTAIDFLKKLWVFVIIAEIIAAIIYAVAFFTQSMIPSLFQWFQGDWVKKAVIIGVAAHPVLGALFAAAEGAKSGFGA